MRVAVVALTFAVLAAPSAVAQDQRVIAQGVTAGGVDLSGLTVDQAASKLSSDSGIAAQISTPLILGAAGLPWRLTAAEAKVALDAQTTAEHAADVVPTTPTVDVPLVLTHSRVAVTQFVLKVAAGTYRAPRSATLKITLKHMLVRKDELGYRLNKRATAQQVNAALQTVEQRRLHQRLIKLHARTTVHDLRRAYPVVLTVDRDHFRLRLFKRLRISKRYPIAVGMAGLETPAGLYHIQNKQVNPAWHVPHDAWAGSLQGQTIPGGAPNNPLKARWLGIANGVGIHGTAEDWSIGSRASHGCIRMHVSDVIDLYPRVPVGTPVLIG
jgi:lipoprotein-anchoring transpeptidase ErfK/SrfK